MQKDACKVWWQTGNPLFTSVTRLRSGHGNRYQIKQHLHIHQLNHIKQHNHIKQAESYQIDLNHLKQAEWYQAAEPYRRMNFFGESGIIMQQIWTPVCKEHAMKQFGMHQSTGMCLINLVLCTAKMVTSDYPSNINYGRTTEISRSHGGRA